MATMYHQPQTYTNEKQFMSILDFLNEQRTENRFCDVILRVGKEQLKAHSNVLAASSPYFGEFLGRGQDHPRAFSQKTPQIIEIHIEGTGDNSRYGDAVSVIVDYMYTSKLKLCSEVLVQVVEIAKIMQMKKVLDYCEKYQNGLPANTISLKDVEVQTSQIDISDTGVQTDGKAHTVVQDILSVNKQTIHNTDSRQKIFNRSLQTDNRKRKSTETDSETQTINNDKTSVERLLKRVGRPSKSLKFKDYESKDNIQSDIDKSNDREKYLKTESKSTNIKTEPTDFCEEKTTEGSGRLPSRKNRGKPPSKFSDDMSSENDEFIIDEAEKSSNTENMYVKPKLLSCEECPYTTYTSYHFNRHQNAHRYEEEKNMAYKCDKCDFSAKRLKYLQEHMREHKHEENICSFCDVKSDNKESLIQHLYTHEPPNPYLCVYCGLKYRTRAQLNVHLPKHLNIKPFVCEICKAGFKWKHALKSHMATHSETKDHLCDVCGFATAHKSQLKAHKLIHTGDTFKCEYPNCKFQSIKKQSLKYHMLTHTQEKAHQCEICGQSFSLQKNLKRHALLHTESRPYKCSFNEECHFATTRYDKLKEHMLKIHEQGEVPTKKFRLSDYPKSLVPSYSNNHLDNPILVNTDISEAIGALQNVIKLENSELNLSQISEGSETKVYIQQPGGEKFPVTLVASKFELPYKFIEKLDLA